MNDQFGIGRNNRLFDRVLLFQHRLDRLQIWLLEQHLVSAIAGHYVVAERDAAFV